MNRSRPEAASAALRASAESAGDPRVLWDLVSDVEGWGDRLPTVTAVRHVGGPSPAVVGSRYEVRQPGLPTAVYEVTEWDPGTTFVWVNRSRGLVSTAWHTVTPTPGGSRLDLAFDWSGPLAPLARLVGSRKGRRLVVTEARTLTRLAEG